MILLFFVLCFVCLFVCFFYRYVKGMKRKSAVVDYDSFTLISVAVVHYNCVPSSSAPSLWKQIILFWEDSSLNFNTDIWHVFKTELLQQGEAGKHYVIILRTSERLLFPRHKRYSNEAKTNYGELGSCFAKCVFFYLCPSCFEFPLWEGKVACRLSRTACFRCEFQMWVG